MRGGERKCSKCVYGPSQRECAEQVTFAMQAVIEMNGDVGGVMMR